MLAVFFPAATARGTDHDHSSPPVVARLDALLANTPRRDESDKRQAAFRGTSPTTTTD
jgi:hypothetical protein